MAGPRRTGWFILATAGVLVALVLLSSLAAAHVDYVAPSDGEPSSPSELFSTVFSNPLEIALLIGGGVLLVLLGAAWLAWGNRAPDVHVLRRTLDGYAEYVPWMLRLSLGIPLVGAGFAGYLFTPAVDVASRIPQVLLGFLLLFGLATRAAAVAGLLGWVASLWLFGTDMLLAAEYIGGFVAIILVGPGRPSADHLLARVASDERTWYNTLDPVHHLADWFQARVSPVRSLAPVIVRVVLGAAFVYLGVHEKIANPGPGLALAVDLGLPELIPLSPQAWLLSAGLIEALVGLLLIIGFFTRAASGAAFLVLTTTLFALPNDPVLPHVTLFGLTSVVFTMGAGAYSLDRLLPGDERPQGAGRASV